MIKKIEILGISIDNYTVREAMLCIENFFNSTSMNTVESISMEMLVCAENDETLRECIEELDLAIINEKEILQAAKVTSAQRIRETTEKKFFKEFIKRVIRNNQTVYLFANSRQDIERLEKFLEENDCGKMKITGNSVVEECKGDYDNLVNDINIESPDIILSVLPSPQQEYFLMENKAKINAQIWYGLGTDYDKMSGISSIRRWIRKIKHKTMLHRMLSKYHQGE